MYEIYFQGPEFKYIKDNNFKPEICQFNVYSYQLLLRLIKNCNVFVLLYKCI